MTTMFKVIAAGAILAAGLSTAAFAQGPGGSGVGHHGLRGGFPPIPDLTADQKQQIANLKATAMQQAAPLREQMVALHKAIRALWSADTLGRQAIAAKQTEMDGLHAKVKAIWTDFFFQLHDVLTPAQRAWLAEHGPGKGGRHGGAGFGPGFGMGPDHD